MAVQQEAHLHAGIADSQLMLFEESSHYPFIEEPEHFLSVVDEFLADIELNIV